MKGESCGFAHGQEDLQPLPDMGRTKLCLAMIKGGTCRNPLCNFAHGRHELRRRRDTTSTQQILMDSRGSTGVAFTNPVRFTSNSIAMPSPKPQEPLRPEAVAKIWEKARQNHSILNCGSNSFKGDRNAQKSWAQSTTDELPDLKDDLSLDRQSSDATCPSEDSEKCTEGSQSDMHVNADLLDQGSGYKVSIRDTFLHFDEYKPFVPLRRIGSAPPSTFYSALD